MGSEQRDENVLSDPSTFFLGLGQCRHNIFKIFAFCFLSDENSVIKWLNKWLGLKLFSKCQCCGVDSPFLRVSSYVRSSFR